MVLLFSEKSLEFILTTLLFMLNLLNLSLGLSPSFSNLLAQTLLFSLELADVLAQIFALFLDLG